MSQAPSPAERRVLIVDDDEDYAASLLDILELHGYRASAAASAAEAILCLEREAAPVALLDIRLGGASGVELVPRLKQAQPRLISIMMTAHVDSRTAIGALRQGAYDYVDKGCETGELLAVLERAFETHQLREERRQAIDTLRQAKEAAEAANRAKSEFLATISHELRTPLNAIMGFSELILKETLGPIGNQTYASYLKDINQSGEHLLGIINDLLDLSKAEAGKLELQEEPVDPAEALRAVCRLMRQRAEGAGLALDLLLGEALPLLHADERKLKQVMVNLLSNAVKFTPEGGRISIIASADPAAGLVIAVTDTGIGIAAEHQERVLQPFAQVDSSLSRRHQGTGLGLPIVKAVMQLHGGTLALDSAVGRGTTVTVTLPASRFLPDRPAAGGTPREAA
jgi:signal transduction histidine kinase